MTQLATVPEEFLQQKAMEEIPRDDLFHGVFCGE